MKFFFTKMGILVAGFLLFGFQVKAQFPSFPPSNVTSVQDRDQMMWQMGLSFPSGIPPKMQDKYKPPFTWPVSLTDPEGNWTDSAGHTITRGGHGLWNNYDDDSTGFLPGGHNGNILNGPQAWRVGKYEPLDLLKMNNGTPITSQQQWWTMRRPEIEKDAAEQLYGVLPADSILPKIKYVVTTTTGGTGATAYIQKAITGYIDSSRYPAVRNKPRLTATLRVPANARGPVPVLIVMYASSQINTYWNLCVAQGFGVCTYDYSSVQPDNGAGLTSYIIGLCNQGNWRKPTDWGVLRAWAWGASKIIDTIRSMPEVDSTQIGMEGHSRWGKATLVAAAFDQRIAFAYSSCAGSLGTAMARHHWGEELEGSSWDQQYHWVAGSFFKWMGSYYNEDSLNARGITDSATRARMLYMPRKVKNMPVDAHSLVALVAPRPIMINGGSTDSWSDPPGEYLAGAGATPVYNLLGVPGLVMNDAKPQLDGSYVEGAIGYRHHNGGHTDALDYPYFFELIKKRMRPWLQDSSLSFTNITSSSMTLSWAAGNGTRRAVFVKENGGPAALPADSTLYTASADWGAKGSQLANSGYYCVYNGMGNSFVLANLNASTTYGVRSFTYNGMPGKELVLKDTGAYNAGTATTTAVVAEPTNHVTNFAAVQGGNNINVTWTDATGATPPAGYIVKAGNSSLADIGVSDGTTEAAGTLVKVVAPGAQTVSFAGVNANTTYYFKIFPYTNPNGNYINYKTDGTVPSATVGTGGLSAATDYYRSKANGNWNAMSTWESSSDSSSWQAATLTPTNSSKAVMIDGNDTVTVTASASAANFIIRPGSQVTVNSGVTLTVPNSLSATPVQVFGTLKNSGTVTPQGLVSIESGGVYEQATTSGTFAAVTYRPGSTLKITASYATNVTLPAGNYRNVTFSGTIGAANFFTLDATGNKTIAEKLLITQTGPGEIAVSSFENGTGFTIGSYEQTGGTVYINRNATGRRLLNVPGDMTVTGGTFDFNKAGTTAGALATLNVGGNLAIGPGAIFTRSNTSAGSTGLTQFNGTAPQTASFGGTPTGPVSYSFNNPLGVTLGSDLTVNDTLGLINGKITLGSYTLTASTITGGSAASYVVTNGTGMLKRLVAGTAVLFPVGTQNNYSPATLTNAGTPDRLGIRVQPGITLPVAHADRVVNLQWNITEDTPGGSNGTVTLQWDAAAQAAGFNAAGPLIMGHYTGSVWEKQLVTSSGSGPYTATGNNYSTFSPFIVAMDGALDNIALPLSSVKLMAMEQAGKVQLQWTAYSESDVSHYTVEKSADGRAFHEIGNVGATNLNGANRYALTDPDNNNSVVYYRLRITDKNGRITYSDVIALNLGKGSVLALLPNPVKNDLFVTHGKADKNSMISVFNLTGVRLQEIRVPEGAIQTTVHTAMLPAGTYMLRFVSGGSVESKQFVIIK